MTARHVPTPIPRALLMMDAGEGHELPPLHGFLILALSPHLIMDYSLLLSGALSRCPLRSF